MPWVWCVQHLLQLLLTFAWQVASQCVCSPCRCRRCCWSCVWRNWRMWPVTASTAGPPPTLSSRSPPTPTPTTPPYQGTSRSQVGGCLLVASSHVLVAYGQLFSAWWKPFMREKNHPPFLNIKATFFNDTFFFIFCCKWTPDSGLLLFACLFVFWGCFLRQFQKSGATICDTSERKDAKVSFWSFRVTGITENYCY